MQPFGPTWEQWFDLNLLYMQVILCVCCCFWRLQRDNKSDREIHHVTLIIYSYARIGIVFGAQKATFPCHRAYLNDYKYQICICSDVLLCVD